MGVFIDRDVECWEQSVGREVGSGAGGNCVKRRCRRCPVSYSVYGLTITLYAVVAFFGGSYY